MTSSTERPRRQAAVFPALPGSSYGKPLTVRAGLRPQIVLLLALLLGVSFVPLYFAVSTYTRTAQSVVQRQQAIELATSLAGTLIHRAADTEVDLRQLLNGRVTALRHLTPEGSRQVASDPAFAFDVPLALDPNESPRVVVAQRGTWVGLSLGAETALWAFVIHHPSILGRLNLLLLSYMMIAGLVLLAGAYFLITYRIIRPIDELSHAARRVTSTDRPLTLPNPRSREFEELNHSLQSMTDRLLQEEAALRAQIIEVETRTQQLRAAQAQLVRSERLASVGQLAAGVAHEIGNPIAALMGLQDLILAGGLSHEEQEEFVRRMRKETERIHRIVRDLLHFARATPAATMTGAARASVLHALNETLGLLRPQPAFREFTVRSPTADDLPEVAVSHEALVQIFLNLLLNAAAACGPNGTVDIEAKRWGGPNNATEQFVEVVVRDDGPGIPPPLRETLFEPFVTGKDVGEGTGLGLSVCRSLIEQVATELGSPHVTIELDQAFTSGARFILRLPINSQTN